MSDPLDPHREQRRAARPSGQDDVDPTAREAVDAERSAALDHDGTDDAIASALRSIEPPADLESRLLTVMRAARAQVEPPPELEARVIEATRRTRAAAEEEATPLWTRRRWMALAASAVACAGGALWWRSQSRLPMEQLVARLTAIVHQGVTLSLMSMDKVAVGEWLRTEQAPRAVHLFPRLDALGRKGCHLYDIEGHPVSLECLVLASMGVLHFFTTPTAGLRGAPPAARTPRVTVQSGLTVATWTHGEQTIVLISEERTGIVESLVG